MWYKKQPDGTWIYANKVYIPTAPQAVVILEFNHEVQIQGWKWYDEPPQEYLDWLDSVRNS